MKFLNSWWTPTILCVVLIIVVVAGEFRYKEITKTYTDSEIVNTTSIIEENKSPFLHGKVAVAFGDSVTEFGNYPDVVARNTGMRVYNAGFGGTRIAHHTSPYYDSFSFTQLVESIVNDDFSKQDTFIQDEKNTFSPRFKLHYKELKKIDFSQVDFISIFLGTNDYMGTRDGVVPLGSETDTTRETFYGGINVAVEMLRERFPNIEIVFITPTWRMNNEQLGGGSAEETPNASGYYLVEYVDALRNRGAHYNIPTLDLYRESGINEKTQSEYLADDVHPTEEGFEYLGKKISDFLIEMYN